jgi:hypothetical protein
MLRRMWWILVGVMLAALLWAAPVHACTPPPGGLPIYTIAEHVAAAPMVFEGTVVAISGQYPQFAVIDVKQYLKGIGQRTIAVSNFGPGSMCLSEVYVGQQGLFFASGDEASGYTAFYLSQFDAILPNDVQTIAEAQAASKQPALNFLPYQVGTADAVMTEARATAYALTPMATDTPAPPPFSTPLPFFTPTPVGLFPPPVYLTDTPTLSTPMPPQMVSALDAVSATTLLLLGICMGLLIGALLGVAVGFQLGRRK